MNCSTRRLASISVCLILLGCVMQLRAQIASLSTKSLSFGSQVIATTPQKNVVLRNTGTSPLVIQSISQPSAPFSESSPPGDLCNLLPATLPGDLREFACRIPRMSGLTSCHAGKSPQRTLANIARATQKARTGSWTGMSSPFGKSCQGSMAAANGVIAL